MLPLMVSRVPPARGPLSGDTDEMRGGGLRASLSSDEGSCSGGGGGGEASARGLVEWAGRDAAMVATMARPPCAASEA